MHTGATHSVCSLPPCGGGVGRGVVVVARDASTNVDPHPQPLPTRGRGAHRVRGAIVHSTQEKRAGDAMSGIADLKVKIFADGADYDGMVKLARNPVVKGF